jgi:hypothetical protein
MAVVAVSAVKQALEKNLRVNSKHGGKPEKSGEGMGSARFQLLVMADGKMVVEHVLLNHPLFEA